MFKWFWTIFSLGAPDIFYFDSTAVEHVGVGTMVLIKNKLKATKLALLTESTGSVDMLISLT